ncbi:MAG: hypothetical protein ACYC3H_01245 [Bellilinea sp.]
MDNFVALEFMIIEQKSLDIIEHSDKLYLDSHLAVAFKQRYEIASPGLLASNQSWAILF